MTKWNGQVHPAAELFPMIEGDEFVALVEDVKSLGLTYPGWLLPDGTLLDGRNRRKACEAAGVEMRWQVYQGDDPIGFVVSQNVRRRHLNVGQLGMLALRMNGLYEEQGRRIMADAAAAELKLRMERKIQGVANLPHPEPKPKRAPLSRDKSAASVGVSGRTVAKAKRVTEHSPDLAEKVMQGAIAIDAAEKEVRIAKAKSAFEQRKADWQSNATTDGDRWQVLRGDFRERLMALDDHSVDAIITDPPYPDEFLPLWGDLAEHAARILRPGAPLIAWSGQFRLQQVLNHLCGPLTYQWTVCLDLPGVNARFRGTNMIQTWKPIIICTNGKWAPHDWHKDRVTSPAKDQALYEWQQNPDPAVELINRYVAPGGLIVDPFVGVGSFGVAALATGRRFIGVELDEDRHAEASMRLGQAA